MNTIGERMKSLIHTWLPERKRFARLEELSGIPSDHWKNFWHGRQRAHEHMIQAIARQWPEHALWLTTGIDDPEFGQTAPSETLKATRTESGKMLSRKIELHEWLSLAGTSAAVDAAKDSARKPEESQGIVERAASSLMHLHELAALHQVELSPANMDAALATLEQRAMKNDEELQAHRRSRLKELGLNGNTQS